MRTGKGTTGWHATVEVRATTIWVWVSGASGRDVLRAALPRTPKHPRALLTMLEGLALCSGAPLSVVIGVDHPVCDSLGLGRCGAEESWPEQSALVSFFIRQPARPPRRLGRFDECTECDSRSFDDVAW
ncbi:MAG: hypothetical protein U0587_07475 [Candidatus Binatia bacterium]